MQWLYVGVHHSGNSWVDLHFFLKWPKNSREHATDGENAWISGNLPILSKPQYLKKQSYSTPIKKTLGFFWERRYISRGQIRRLTRFLSVPKWKTDIWMVYDRTGSRLNKYIWSPSLGLTSIHLVLREVGLESYFWDNDLGKVFLNLPLPVIMHPYCGVDLKSFYS